MFQVRGLTMAEGQSVYLPVGHIFNCGEHCKSVVVPVAMPDSIAALKNVPGRCIIFIDIGYSSNEW